MIAFLSPNQRRARRIHERHIRRVVVVIAARRIAFGLAMLAVPEVVGRAWIGADGERPAVVPIIRALGARDGLIGVGTVLAAREGGPGLVRWVQAAALADAADAVATLAAARHLPTSKVAGIVAIAAPSALVGVWASTRLA
jgi:hypothetical protein